MMVVVDAANEAVAQLNLSLPTRHDWLVLTLLCQSHSSPKLREVDESGMGFDARVDRGCDTRRARRLSVETSR